mgnify:CR=1 FL=1
MKFYKLSGIGYPVKIHKFYILLFDKIKSIRNH